MSTRPLLLITAALAACGLVLFAALAPTGPSRHIPEAESVQDPQPPPIPEANDDLPPLIVDEPAETPKGMVWVSGGEFVMGTDLFPESGQPNVDRIKADEVPAHEVELDGFWMDEAPVTNREFAEFVAMTGYVTYAETKPKREDFAYPGLDISQIKEEDLVAGSICFNENFNRENLVTEGPGWEYQVWMLQPGANWRHPNGPGSSIEDRMDHPVVHVNWNDAVAYCKWAGKRLPTEAQFEYAARAGDSDRKYWWGDELTPQGEWRCNIWQGTFPTERLNEDGYEATSPVKAFGANELGLYDMAGNVWEWCRDVYHAEYYSFSPRRNPQGPPESFDPQEPGIPKRAQRGGSFMCNTNNCTGYRCGARMRGEVTSSSFHNGFRGVVEPSMIDEYRAAQAKTAEWRNSRAD